MVAPSLPLELWDIIIDLIGESRNHSSLEVCSLVCRSLVARAQSHIFRSIYIGNSSASARIRDPYARPQIRDLSPSAARLMQRIAHLSHSPHLLPHVRELNIRACEEKILLQIAQIPWPRIQALSLGLMGNSLEHSALQHLHTLVSLPSLRHLTFRDCWEAASLQSVIVHSTAPLEKITFEFCDVDFHWASLPASAVSTRLRIRELTLFDSPAVSDALIHPAFPLDFSALTHLQLMESVRPAVRSFMHLTGATITHLETFDDGMAEFLQNLDLSLMFALTDISLRRSALLVLIRLPAGNRLARLRIRMYDFDIRTFASEVPTSVTACEVGTRINNGDLTVPLSITHASAFEAFVLRALPALRRVEIEVVLPVLRRVETEVLILDRTNVTGILQASLPRLHENGMLFVEHNF